MSPDGEFWTLPWASLHSIVTGTTNNGWLAGPTALCDCWETPSGCLFGSLYRGREGRVLLEPPGCGIGIETAGVNARGDVVGSCHATRSSPDRGYMYADGEYEFIE